MCMGVGYATGGYRRGNILDKRDLSEVEACGYLSHFSETMNDEMVEYVTNVVMKQSRYLFISRKGKQQFAYCTHCKVNSAVKGLKHGSKVSCPACNSLCIAKSSGRGRQSMRDYGFFTYYEKSKMNSKAIVARSFYVKRDYTGSYIDVESEISTEAYYIFEPNKKPVLMKGSYKYGFSRAATVYSLGENKSSFGYFQHSGNVVCCIESIMNAVTGTPFEYSCWEQFVLTNQDLVKYFALFSEHPKVEYMIKNGLSEIVLKKVDGESLARTVNWKAKTVEAAVGMNIAEIKQLKEAGIEIDINLLMFKRASKKFGWNLSVELMKIITSEFREIYAVEQFLKATEMANPAKLINYTKKQMETKNYYTFRSAVSEWMDYIGECKELGADLNNDQIMFPKNLKEAHQETTARIKYIADEKFNDVFKKRSKQLKKYCFRDAGLTIRPVASPKELITEGTILKHCVGSYSKNHASGGTSILVIREIKALDKPYYTVELKEGKVLQVRGLRNCNPNKKVEAFMEKFKTEKLNKKSRKKTETEAVVCRI